MITFLNMAFLAALPLAAAPVLVHLLNRRKRDVIHWGAMQFLLEAMPRRQRFWQAEDRLLMILRCLALLLFILAIAQPLVRSRLFGTSGQRDVVLVIDRSLSTGEQSSQGTSIEKIAQGASQVLSDLNASDRVRVLLAGQTPTWITNEFSPLTTESRTDLDTRIGQIKPTFESVDWPRCLSEASAAANDPQSTHGVVVLTDGQAHGWRTEAGGVWRGLHDAFDPQHGGSTANILLGPPTAKAANLAIVSLTSMRDRIGVGEPVTLTATVRNYGNAPAGSAMLNWSQGATSIGASQIKPLAPDESTSVEIEHAFDNFGVFEVRARVEMHDALEADNEWSRVVEVVESIPILIVSGNGSDDAIENQVHYLLAALGEQKKSENRHWQSVFRPNVIAPAALAGEELSKYPCIVLANVSQIDAAVVGQLRRFAESGGGLWLLPGDGLDRASFNHTFCQGPDALIAATLEASVTSAPSEEQTLHILPPTDPHPTTLLLADTQRLDLDRVQINRHYALALPATEKETSTLLKISDNAPLAIMRPLGRGHVILQTVPMGTSWSNAPLHQSYVVWVNEWLAWLSGPSGTTWNVPAEQSILLTLGTGFAANAKLTTPLGATVDLQSSGGTNRRVFRYEGTSSPGRYELSITDGNGGARTFPFVVQRDTDESNLSPLKPEQTQTLSVASGVHFVEKPLEGIQAGRSVAPRAEPAWTFLLLTLIGLLLAELLLAGRLTRKRFAPAEPVQRDPAISSVSEAAHAAVRA